MGGLWCGGYEVGVGCCLLYWPVLSKYCNAYGILCASLIDWIHIVGKSSPMCTPTWANYPRPWCVLCGHNWPSPKPS